MMTFEEHTARGMDMLIAAMARPREEPQVVDPACGTGGILHEPCARCGAVDEPDAEDSRGTVLMRDGTTQRWCEQCIEQHAVACTHCGDWSDEGAVHWNRYTQPYCIPCWDAG